MMVGGNIMGMTRNIPTAIAMESPQRHAFAQGVAWYGLLALALALNFSFPVWEGKGCRELRNAGENVV